MRKLLISGRLVSDAEKKSSKAGREYLRLRLANNEARDEKDANGNYKQTFWVTVLVMNPNQLGLVQYLTKGKPIQVIGDFEDNTYQDKNNVCQIGRTVIANSIDFINDGENKPANNGQTTSQTQSQTQVQTAAPTQQTTTELPKFNTTQQAVAQNVAVNAANPSVVDEPVDDLPF